ncbi:SSB protein [Arthrobacter phage Bumble]|uniref:SsDNA-binding protein n=1 Tax=Arthrobacter phage Bumble TaxID=2743904 RepID=A0A7G3VA03_9CAUD|nr:ssDNA-binding protein [Arthrobacter phage Bumble]
MAGDTTITLIGNLTSDPELRFTPSGSAVANFTIASTPRTFNRNSNEWEDGETLFLRSSVWREAAENVAETLTKGMRVIASGRLKSRSYETKEGEKRTVIEFEIDEIGPSLRYAQAKVTRIQSGGQSGGGQGGFSGGQGGGSRQSGSYAGGSMAGGGSGGRQGPPAQDDPWAAPGAGQGGGGWGNGPDSEPPF